MPSQPSHTQNEWRLFINTKAIKKKHSKAIKFGRERRHREGQRFPSAWLCPVERVPAGLHAHGALATISAPFRSGPSFPHYVTVSLSPVSREASLFCVARSVLRPWSCSNYESRCEGIQFVWKHTLLFFVHVYIKTNIIFPTFQTRRDSRDGCFWPAREEDRRAS